MNRKISYEKLFKYRSLWMGFAIIWIFYYHMGFDIELQPFKAIKDIGYAGCDIFLFSSGLGIYYSLDKDNKLDNYFWKRISRLLPCLIAVIPWIIFKFKIGEMTIQAAIGNILGIQYFVDAKYDFNWYIPVLILCYIIAVFVKPLLDNFQKSIFGIIVIIIFYIIAFVFSNNALMMMGMTRIPVFIIGMIFAKKSKNKENIGIIRLIICILLIIPGVVLIHYSVNNLGWNGWFSGLNWIPFILAVPGICFIISLIGMLFEKNVITTYVNKGVAFLGKHSLEIFLSHATLVLIFRDYMIVNNPSLDTTKNWCILICISIVGAVIIYWIDRGVKGLAKCLIKSKK